MIPSTLLRMTMALGACSILLAAGPAGSAAADYDVVLELGQSERIDGDAVAGVNPGHFAGTDETYPCGSDPSALCRTIFVTVTNPFGDDAAKGRERANLTLGLDGDGAGEAALMVYESDADGARGPQVANSDELGTLADESAAVVVTTTEDSETKYYLVEVFFHAWAGTWGLDASFS